MSTENLLKNLIANMTIDQIVQCAVDMVSKGKRTAILSDISQAEGKTLSRKIRFLESDYLQEFISQFNELHASLSTNSIESVSVDNKLKIAHSFLDIIKKAEHIIETKTENTRVVQATPKILEKLQNGEIAVKNSKGVILEYSEHEIINEDELHETIDTIQDLFKQNASASEQQKTSDSTDLISSTALNKAQKAVAKNQAKNEELANAATLEMSSIATKAAEKMSKQAQKERQEQQEEDRKDDDRIRDRKQRTLKKEIEKEELKREIRKEANNEYDANVEYVDDSAIQKNDLQEEQTSKEVT